MTNIVFSSESEAKVLERVGSDLGIVRAARVSTGQEEEEMSEARVKGLINYLMKNRHGTPFEHNMLSFKVTAPIFVFREWHRHRIGWSYNEISGRYTEMKPEFYVIPSDRPIIQEGSGAHPKLVAGPEWLVKDVQGGQRRIAQAAWAEYERQLGLGVANEVARDVLPLSLYTSMQATTNLRAAFAFLSLRVDGGEGAVFSTKPLWEIEMVARQVEAAVAEQFPVAYEAFINNGRVAP